MPTAGKVAVPTGGQCDLPGKCICGNPPKYRHIQPMARWTYLSQQGLLKVKCKTSSLRKRFEVMGGVLLPRLKIRKENGTQS